MTWWRCGWLALLVVALACGGEAVIDQGAGGAATTSSSGSGACDALALALEDALTAARSCDSCSAGPDPCATFSGLPVSDACGCPVSLNFEDASALEAVVDAYYSWADAPCAPRDCDVPCAISNHPTCVPAGGGCDGECRF